MNHVQQSQGMYGLTYGEISIAAQYSDEEFRRVYMAPSVRGVDTRRALQGAPQSATEPCSIPPDWVGGVSCADSVGA